MGFNTRMVMNIMNILDDLGVPPIFGHPFWTGLGQGYYPEADYLDLFEVKTWWSTGPWSLSFLIWNDI
jgi:hypothetical protein